MHTYEYSNLFSLRGSVRLRSRKKVVSTTRTLPPCPYSKEFASAPPPNLNTLSCLKETIRARLLQPRLARAIGWLVLLYLATRQRFAKPHNAKALISAAL